MLVSATPSFLSDEIETVLIHSLSKFALSNTVYEPLDILLANTTDGVPDLKGLICSLPHKAAVKSKCENTANCHTHTSNSKVVQ